MMGWVGNCQLLVTMVGSGVCDCGIESLDGRTRLDELDGLAWYW